MARNALMMWRAWRSGAAQGREVHILERGARRLEVTRRRGVGHDAHDGLPARQLGRHDRVRALELGELGALDAPLPDARLHRRDRRRRFGLEADLAAVDD